jgi:leader peptidase (prepilin peptidase)/N-methyltransferase
LGLGDGKLLAVMGALLGWEALPPIVFAASFVGIVVSIPVLLLKRRKRSAVEAKTRPVADAGGPADPAPSIRRSEVPFGPFLATSAIGYLFLHRQIWALIERGLSGG